MAKNVDHIQHIKSSVVIESNGVLSPKLPSPSVMAEGEIAVNFAEGHETLSIKNSSGDIVTFSCDDKFYDKKFIDNKLGSGFTGENSATTVTQMIEENELVTSSALNDLKANKADISAVTDVQDDISELSAITTAHTANTTIHLTSSEKSNLHSHSNKSALDSITGSVGTMAYENTSVLNGYADSVKYNSTSHKVEFYHGTTAGTMVFSFDASAFIIDGMVDNVEIADVTSGASTVKCLVVSFNTDAGKQDINIPLSDIFDSDLYYTKQETSGATEISTALAAKANSDELGETIHYLTGMTGAAGGTNLSASWSGECSEITELYTGLCVRFLIPTAGHATGVTLSINGGEKHKVLYNNTTLTTHYGANTVLNLTYDANTTGTYYSGSSTQASVQGVWRANADYDSNTNTIGYQIGHNQKIYKTNAATYRYMLLLQKDETTLTPVNTKSNTTAGTKTLTTESFIPFGDIIYYSTTTTVSAGGVMASGTTWTQYGLNLAYSFNTTDTLVSGQSVYIVAVPQSDGKAKLHSSPISQVLPTTEDGLIYIYLGQAYSDTNIYLLNNHPIYYYKDGQIRLYTNSIVSSVDQVLNDTTSASTNPVATKAVYNTIKDTELVWTNAYNTLSGVVSSHTSDTSIHLSASDRTNLDSITGSVGTMAYEDASSYSSATEVNTALGNKADASHSQGSDTISSMTSYSMALESGAITTADTLNQAIGKLEKADAEIYDKFGSGFTGVNSGRTVTKVIEDNERVIAESLTDLNDRKLDASAFTNHSYTSNEIVAMTSYSIASTSGAITTSDTLNQAIGKLERGNNDISSIVGSGFTLSSITDVIINDEKITAFALNDLDDKKVNVSDFNKAGEGIHILRNVGGTVGGTGTGYVNDSVWSGTCDDFTSLYDGLMVQIKIPVSGFTSGTSLSINGGAAHPVIYNASTKISTIYPTGTTLVLVYDSSISSTLYFGNTAATTVQGVWKKMGEYNTNTTYTVMPNIYAPYATYKAYSAIYRYQVLLQKNETTLLPTNGVSGSTGTSKTMTTEEFDPFGNIFYYNVTATTSANTAIATGRTYQQVLADMRYAFNTSSSFTASRSVYLVAVPQANGMAKLHSAPISQTLPTTDDGLIYIYLGVAYDTYRIEMTINHPIYQFKNGQLRQYVGSMDYLSSSDVVTSITTSNSGSTSPASVSAVMNVIKDNEEVISSALNDINSRLTYLEGLINSLQNGS